MTVSGRTTLTFDDLLRRRPLIHNARTWTWQIHRDLAAFLDEHVGADTVSLETGAGLSTLVILRKAPRLHIAVQPTTDEFAAIVEFAAAHDIDTRALRPVVAPSQSYLPTADLPALDLVLIDGDHSFPAPFLDWYYTADRLKVGGLMIVDDIQIGTGTILEAFLGAEPGWEPLVVQPERFAIYRKRAELVHTGDWALQPFLHDRYPTASVSLISRGAEEKWRAERRALEEELDAARQLLGTVREERDAATDAARQAGERIVAMESSKFWKLRGAWFRARRALGRPGTE